MSKMKSMLGMYALAAAAMAMGADVPSRRYIEPKESEEEIKQRLAEAEIERNKSRGLKAFFYGEKSLWARDQKNADRKAKNKNWI
jgi:hypothetical protein